MFIEYRPTDNIAKTNNPKQGLLGIIFIFHVSVEKIFFSTSDMRQSKTLLTVDERGSEIATTSVFACHLSPVGRLKQSKTLFLTIFGIRSSKIMTFLIASYPV